MEFLVDHRYAEVLAALNKRSKPKLSGIQARLYQHLKSKTPDTEVEQCLALHDNLKHREAINGFLLSGAGLDIIYVALEISIEVLEIYRYLFFDVDVFQSRLDKADYAKYLYSNSVDRAVAEANRMAMIAGPDYLVWFWNPQKSSVSPTEVVNRTMIDSYYRSFAHSGASLTSKLAQDALKLAKDNVRTAKVVEEMCPSDSMNAAEAIKFAIQQFDETHTPDTLGAEPDEILK